MASEAQAEDTRPSDWDFQLFVQSILGATEVDSATHKLVLREVEQFARKHYGAEAWKRMLNCHAERGQTDWEEGQEQLDKEKRTWQYKKKEAEEESFDDQFADRQTSTEWTAALTYFGYTVKPDKSALDAEFRKRSKKLHPDCPGGSVRLFQELNLHYEQIKITY